MFEEYTEVVEAILYEGFGPVLAAIRDPEPDGYNFTEAQLIEGATRMLNAVESEADIRASEARREISQALHVWSRTKGGTHNGR